MNKILIGIGIVLLIGGVIFSILPPETHMAIFGGQADSHSEMEGENMAMNGESMQQGDMKHNHGLFVTIGLVIAVIGLGTSLAGWKIFD